MRATVGESQTRASDQILDGAGDEHLRGVRRRGDASADVDGDSAYIVVPQLDLARMEPGTHLNPESA